MTASRVCHAPRCIPPGTIGLDGYCETCGTKAASALPSATASNVPTPVLTVHRGTIATGSVLTSASRPRSRARSRGTGPNAGIGAPYVSVPAVPPVDPATKVLVDPVVPEEQRFCPVDGEPVGRSRGGEPGRLAGFGAKCGHPFDFRPKLQPGDVLGGQYEVVGCLAHGGVGWIYLAKDRAVNDQWVVLKGLLNAGDDAAMAAFVQEKAFLAEISHGDIVHIVNFVTHRGAGYIVMEYVGGLSLHQILRARRTANGGQPNPLPAGEAIAYILAVLPTFAYLHDRFLVYCDFTPDNAIQVGDRVKLIDLGAVRRLADTSGDIYGTPGFEAPEIAELGPSIASDLYTLGRTLAVLALDFRRCQSTYQYSLPDPADHPALARFDSFHRFLLKSTAPARDDRFQSAAEMHAQLERVQREVVALTTGQPMPGPSVAFVAPAGDEELPGPATDPGDPAAAFLASLSANQPDLALRAIEEAIAAGHVADTVEVRLRRAGVLITTHDHDAAATELDKVTADDPWEWRAVWLAGVSALATGDLDAARREFDRCWLEVPGELAPKLAAGLAAERAGDLVEAAGLHAIVVTVDPSQVAAARGLARCRARTGDLDGAIDAFDGIPANHRAYVGAQVDAVRTLVAFGQFRAAADRLERLDLDERRRAELDVERLEAELAVCEERALRLELEQALRRLAELLCNPAQRRRGPDRARYVAMVDRAYHVRPWTLR
jgi:serine/threonine-protein kinase PknG